MSLPIEWGTIRVLRQGKLQPWLQIVDQQERDLTLQLTQPISQWLEQLLLFCAIGFFNEADTLESRPQCYKTFYDCNLQIFVISQSVSPWQAFPAQSNVLLVRPGGFPRVENLKGASLGQAMPYLQILDQAGKACQGQTLQLITEIRKLRPKKFYNIGPSSVLSLLVPQTRLLQMAAQAD